MPQKVGPYRLESLIKEGSFSSVYRAFDETHQRDVALKLLKPPWLHDPQAVERFKQEAKTVARLDHPHIAAVYEVGEAEGQVYLAQHWVEGETLAARLKRGPLSWPEMLEILHPVASALDYARQRGVLHRDIKPANILLDKNGGVYLTDFGLVRVAEGSAELSATSSGQAGTPAYMAPEMWEGKEVTSATDIYALTCVVVEMLTGRPLFDGPTPARARQQHLGQGPKFPADLPAGALEIFNLGLAPNPVYRLRTAGELATVLARLAGLPQPDPIYASSLDLPGIVPPASSPKKQGRGILKIGQTRSGLLAAGITAFVVIIIGLTVLACLSLYWFNTDLPVVAQSSANSTSTRPAAELPAILTPTLEMPSPTPAMTLTSTPQAPSPSATSRPALTPTSRPATATPLPPTPTVPQPSATATALPVTPTQAETTPAAVAEIGPSATATVPVEAADSLDPASSPTPTAMPPAQPALMPSPMPTEPVIPEGKGMLIYQNKTDYELIIDIINPTTNTMVETAILAPGIQKEFILDPGQYTFNSHTAGGDLSISPAWFDIVEGQWQEFICC